MTSQHYSIKRLRSSLLFFSGGKVVSALLNFAGLILIVRLLDTTNYAYYVTCIAAVEMLFAVASFGLDWVAIRYVPEFKVCAPANKLRNFIFQVSTLQVAIYLVFATAMALASRTLAEQLGMPAIQTGLTLYAIYALVEGAGRVMRDQILGHLLLQGRAQIALLARNIAWVTGLSWLYFQGNSTTLYYIAIIDIVAACVGTIIVGIGLFWAMTQTNSTSRVTTGAWEPPPLKDMWKLARASYISYLCSLAYGPQVLTFLLGRYAGLDATAAFGLARSLADQVKRYLPTELFLGLIRPALVARYVASKDFVAFNRNVSLILVISLLALSPLVVLAVVFGDVITVVVSRKSFSDSGVFLALMIATLAPFSHRRIVETVANTIGLPDACLRANAGLIVLPLLTLFFLKIGQPAWLCLALSLLAEFAFGILVIQDLRRNGIPYSLPWKALVRIIAAIISSISILSLWSSREISVYNLIISIPISLIVIAISLLTFKPLRGSDAVLIRRFLTKET